MGWGRKHCAMCRKAATGDKEFEVWGDGKQTRLFMYIDDCIEATLRLMRQDKFYGLLISDLRKWLSLID